MAERTAYAAVRDFVQHTHRALQCVTDAHILLSRQGYSSDRGPHLLWLAGESVRVTPSLSVSMRLYYQVERLGSPREGWDVSVSAYYYTLHDPHEREVLGYHWHPDTPGTRAPHLHIGPGIVRRELLARAGLSEMMNPSRPDIMTAHLPTGYMSVDDFMRMLMTQLDVRPRRDDWEMVLDPP